MDTESSSGGGSVDGSGGGSGSTRDRPWQRRAQNWLRRRWFLLFVVVAFIAAWYSPTGWMIVSPGDVLPLAAQITVERDGPARDEAWQAGPGPATQRQAGDVLLLTVSARRANPYQLAAWHAGLMPEAALLPETAMIPPGMTDEQYVSYGQGQMRESAGLAVVLALREAGFGAVASGCGAAVIALQGGSAGPESLQSGDVITAAAGKSVCMAGDLAPILRDLAPGSVLSLSAVREGTRISVSAPLQATVPGAEEGMLPALLVTADPYFEFPFPIEIDTGDIGGPSGGLAMAIAVYQALSSEDILGGRTVAASGFVRADGSVGPVGGVRHKAMAAAEAGASVLLVAPANAAEARSAGTGLMVVEVTSFGEALAYLRESCLTSVK